MKKIALQKIKLLEADINNLKLLGITNTSFILKGFEYLASININHNTVDSQMFEITSKNAYQAIIASHMGYGKIECDYDYVYFDVDINKIQSIKNIRLFFEYEKHNKKTIDPEFIFDNSIPKFDAYRYNELLNDKYFILENSYYKLSDYGREIFSNFALVLEDNYSYDSIDE